MRREEAIASAGAREELKGLDLVWEGRMRVNKTGSRIQNAANIIAERYKRYPAA
jgi:hypothetical protein